MATYSIVSRDKLDGGKERVVVSIVYAGTESYSSGVNIDPFQIGLPNAVDSVIVENSGSGLVARGIAGGAFLGSPSAYVSEASPGVGATALANWPKIRFFQTAAYGGSGSFVAAPLVEVTATPANTVRVVATGW